MPIPVNKVFPSTSKNLHAGEKYPRGGKDKRKRKPSPRRGQFEISSNGFERSVNPNSLTSARTSFGSLKFPGTREVFAERTVVKVEGETKYYGANMEQESNESVNGIVCVVFSSLRPFSLSSFNCFTTRNTRSLIIIHARSEVSLINEPLFRRSCIKEVARSEKLEGTNIISAS